MKLRRTEQRNALVGGLPEPLDLPSEEVLVGVGAGDYGDEWPPRVLGVAVLGGAAEKAGDPG